MKLSDLQREIDEIQNLLTQFKRMQREVDELSQKLYNVSMAIRQARLMEVDAIERAYDKTPRTAHLRKEYKQTRKEL